jgi:hypothetical protein
VAIGAVIAATTRTGSNREWAPKRGIVRDVLGDAGYIVIDERTIHDEHVAISCGRHVGALCGLVAQQSVLLTMERFEDLD